MISTFTLLCDKFFDWSPERFSNPWVIVGLVLMVLGMIAAFGATKFSSLIAKRIKKKESASSPDSSSENSDADGENVGSETEITKNPEIFESAETVNNETADAESNEKLLSDFENGKNEKSGEFPKKKKSRYNYDKYETIFKIAGYIVVVAGALIAIVTL